MKRSQAVILTVAALAISATVALAADTPSTAPASGTTPAKTEHHSTKSTSKSTTKTVKTDINTASKEDLMKLPGVDDAIADKIVAGRPFKSSQDLVSKNIVTSSEFTKLHPHVTAAAPKTAAK